MSKILGRYIAQKLLGQTQYPLSEVAFLTGISEQRAFQRAFKRWTGNTPLRYREAAEPA